MNQQDQEICNECLGTGRICKASKVLSNNLRARKCNTCKGEGTTNSITNSAFLNNVINEEVVIYD